MLEHNYTFMDFDRLLPLSFEDFEIEEVDWSKFLGIPDPLSPWKAHTYWNIGFNYELGMKRMKGANCTNKL